MDTKEILENLKKLKGLQKKVIKIYSEDNYFFDLIPIYKKESGVIVCMDVRPDLQEVDEEVVEFTLEEILEGRQRFIDSGYNEKYFNKNQ